MLVLFATLNMWRCCDRALSRNGFPIAVAYHIMSLLFSHIRKPLIERVGLHSPLERSRFSGVSDSNPLFRSLFASHGTFNPTCRLDRQSESDLSRPGPNLACFSLNYLDNKGKYMTQSNA